MVKLSPAGTLLFSSYLGGRGGDEFNSIAVDQKQNAYLTGRTFSIDFPTTKIFGTIGTAFVMKINSTGHLLYSIQFGGGAAEGTGITIDRAGSVYVCGWVSPSDYARNAFPVTTNAFDKSFNGLTDAFVMKLLPDGSQILYSTYLGGSLFDRAEYISVDRAGKIYVAGITFSVNFPIKNPILPRKNSSFYDVFVTVLDPDGSTLVYSTYYGGSREDNITGLAVDRDGTTYLTGVTRSADLPVVNKIARAHGLLPHCLEVAYLAKIPPLGTRLVFSSYLGFAGCDGYSPRALSVRGSGIIYLTGAAYFPDLTKLSDAFVLRIISNP